MVSRFPISVKSCVEVFSPYEQGYEIGTHAEKLSDLFPFIILKNSSISAGVKRVEAVAGKTLSYC